MTAHSLVGAVGIVRCTTRLHDITSVGITNDQGGSSFLPEGSYRVRVTRAWDDDEIGGRAEGVLVDPADIETAREAGTTGFPVRQPLAPERVFFAQADFTPIPVTVGDPASVGRWFVVAFLVDDLDLDAEPVDGGSQGQPGGPPG
jgi:hypothetical protein